MTEIHSDPSCWVYEAILENATRLKEDSSWKIHKHEALWKEISRVHVKGKTT